MSAPSPLNTLKKRGEFLRVRGGPKWSGPAFLLDCKPALLPGPPRFGFTVTKKLAKKAVDRNRMRRRLKEAVRASQAGYAQDGFDYVVVARAGALDVAFDTLCQDFQKAFKRVHRVAPATSKPVAS